MSGIIERQKERKEAFKNGQQDFKNKVLAELEKRYGILDTLENENAFERKYINSKMYHDCKVEIYETIKTINLIEL
jgi:hypothetical protein